MPGTPDSPDVGELCAQNARLREQVERLELLNEDKDAVIADLRARNDELAENLARLERLISRNSVNSSMPPSTDDLPGKKQPGPKPQRGGKKRSPASSPAHRGRSWRGTRIPTIRRTCSPRVSAAAAGT